MSETLQPPPHATDDLIEQARVLFSGECRFMFGVHRRDQIPECTLPEFAFIGRSNVGKSSLINTLTFRRSLARTSHTPGRTQQLNYFDLQERLYIVDMPGYGYAKVSKTISSAWRSLMREYLYERWALKRVYVLVDSRIGLKPLDLDMFQRLDETAVSYRVVLTKVDKISMEQRAKLSTHIEDILRMHPAAHPKILETSAAKKHGLEMLRYDIYQLYTT